MSLLELLAATALLAHAGPEHPDHVDAVVTFDNGEFNLPLYTPRWNGRWTLPSAAQEIVTGIARVNGKNPKVFSYLPPGRTAGRPGSPFEVQARRPRCEGPAETPNDPCWCRPAEKCWDQLGPNYHPEASTSLYMTATSVRESVRDSGPRVEVHITDLFEEDPTAADDPADSDRCITAPGSRKALEGVLRLPPGESLDHLAVGVLRVNVEPPPPGGSWGWTYDLKSDDGRCWSGVKGFAWESVRAPVDMAMAVVVLGVDTAAHATDVDAFVDGLVGQLGSEAMSLDLVRLREPTVTSVVEATLTASELRSWEIRPPGRAPRLPCDSVHGEARITTGTTTIAPDHITAGCDGVVQVSLPQPPLERAFLGRAGMDPSFDELVVSGEILLRGDEQVVVDAFAGLGALAKGGDRPLPLWDTVGEALQIAGRSEGERPWGPWTYRLEIRSLTVTGLDNRPWLLAIIGAFASAIALSVGTYVLIEKSDAARAFATHWERNVGPGRDPLRQRPLAAVLAEAQEEVRQWRGRRMAIATTVGLFVAVLAFWILIRLHMMRLGNG